jgi:hypothetical protein
MRTVLKISTVLSWFNLLIWGFIIAMFLLGSLESRNMAFLVFAFLFSVIVLHSYAALQLRKSIINPSRPLSSQTPAGIRFIGAVALFAGIVYFADGVALLQNPQEFLKMLQVQFPPAKNIPLASIRLLGGFILICGLSITLNVILNFRLLRWYHFMKGMM